MRAVSIISPARVAIIVILSLSLAACERIGRLDNWPKRAGQPVTRLEPLPLADQPCDVDDTQLPPITGAHLRQLVDQPLSLTPVLVTGRGTRTGLASTVRFTNPEAQATFGIDIELFSYKAAVTARDGFGNQGLLPNIYDVTYADRTGSYSGPVVVGQRSLASNLPSASEIRYSGRVAVDVRQSDADGMPDISSTNGRFAFEASFGSKRSTLKLSGLGDALPFKALEWTNIYHCGGRLVSSGEGRVRVLDHDNKVTAPFQVDRDPVAITAVLDGAFFAADDPQAPPEAVGGMFLIQTDSGAITGLFLSTVPELVGAEEGST